MNKVTRAFKVIVESIWFAVAGLCIIIAVREIVRHNVMQALIFVALALVSLFFYMYHRHQRKSLQQ